MRGTRMFTRTLAGGVALIGVTLLVGGVWLLMLGGSGFYALQPLFRAERDRYLERRRPGSGLAIPHR